MSVETQGTLTERNDKDVEVLFPHLNITNTKTESLNKQAEKANDDITFIYTSKFSNLCDTKQDAKPRKQKAKQQKQSPFHSQKRSCRLPGTPTFEDFFGENASHTSRYIAPHLCKRLNAIVIRKTENFETANTEHNEQPQPERKSATQATEPAIQSPSKSKSSLKVKEMQAFLGKHFPFTNKANPTSSRTRYSSNNYDKPLSKLKSPLTKDSKCRYIQEINPHVNMYDDIRLLDKSTSCQRIDHLNRLMNLQFKYPIQSNANGYLYTTSNKNNSVNDLFRVTRENRIKYKINDLMKFTIFPNYNIRKIDIDLKRQYAKNNLNIIGGIQEQFEENKKQEMKQRQTHHNDTSQNKNETSHHSELDEDIDIDNLL